MSRMCRVARRTFSIASGSSSCTPLDLLRGSFRPEAEITALRTLIRHRDKLVEDAAMYTQRMQKALTLMNLQLHNVISDVTGLTGMTILREIASGETNPATLARHRDRRCKATEQEIAASLTGSYREEHLFVLRQTLEVYDFYGRRSNAAIPRSRRDYARSRLDVSRRRPRCRTPGRIARESFKRTRPRSRSAHRCIS